MSVPEKKRRGRYNQYLEQQNPYESMPRRTRFRYDKAITSTSSAEENQNKGTANYSRIAFTITAIHYKPTSCN